jgi:hypothetical protein
MELKKQSQSGFVFDCAATSSPAIGRNSEILNPKTKIQELDLKDFGAVEDENYKALLCFSGCFSFLSSKKLIRLFNCFRRPFSFGLQFLEIVQLLVADNSSAFWKSAASEERAFLALPNH